MPIKTGRLPGTRITRMYVEDGYLYIEVDDRKRFRVLVLAILQALS